MGFPMPGLAKSKGPCTCDDIPDIEKRLKEIDETRAGWQQVLTDMFRNPQNAPKTPADARQHFKDAMGWGSGPTTQAGGLDPNTGDVKTDPVWESQHCDAVVEANIVHEKSHAADYRVRIPFLVIFGAPAKALAMSEIDARDREEAFLQEKLQELRQNCGQWRCKCNGQLYNGAAKCSIGCPPPSLACIAPTCYEIDPKTGKKTGKAF
ncbi:MAG TPA: hypothetical protein VI685_19975 [Candidatus Angelobacter sp.]